MTHLISLNELTVVRLIYFMFLRRKVVLLPTVPLFPQFARLLKKIADWATRSKRVQTIEYLCPDLMPEWEHPLTMMHNIFAEIESWQKAYYRFEWVEKRLPDYGMAFKQVTSNYLTHRLYTMLSIYRAIEEIGRENVHVFGILPDIADAMKAYIGPETKENISPLRMPRRILNLLLTLPLLLYGFAWILSRCRLSTNPAKLYFFAADYIGDPDDINLYREIEEGGPILLAARNKGFLKGGVAKNAAHYDTCLISDGIFSIGQALDAAGYFYKETVRFFVALGGLEVPLYYLLFTMPFRRIVYRGLFNRYRPKIYWARDSYNVEHNLRRMELKRVGCLSWCSFHAYPAYTCIYPMFRYLSFDRIYTISQAFHKKYYYDTWCADIEVVAASTFRASRKMFARRIPMQDRPNSILILCATSIREPSMISFVRTIATAFPGRVILLQVKPNYSKWKIASQFIDQCTENLKNIEVTHDPFYELLLRTRYVFSDPSTAVMEAIQFGACSFTVDNSTIQKATTMRDMHDICVTTGDEAVSKIIAIEDGSWSYPIENLKNFVNLSGECFHDTVRKDLGLPARESARPMWEHVGP